MTRVASEKPALTGARVRRRVSFRSTEVRSIVFVGDALASITAAWAAPEVWATFDIHYVPTQSVPYWQVASAVLWMVALRVAGRADSGRARILKRSLGSIVQALAVMTGLVLGLFYISPFFAPRGSTLLALPLMATATFAWRALYAMLLEGDVFSLPVAIVGTDEAAQRTARAIRESRMSPYRVQAFVGSAQDVSSIDGIPVVGPGDDLGRSFRNWGRYSL